MDPDKYIKSHHEIVSGIYIGNEAAAKDLKFLENIDVVINATKHLPFSAKKINIKVPINDPGPVGNLYLEENNEYLSKALPKLVATIHGYRMSGKRILVHCHAGAQRSAAIVAAYLITHGDWKISDKTKKRFSKKEIINEKYRITVKHIISKRPVAFFGGRSVNFKQALNIYKDTL